MENVITETKKHIKKFYPSLHDVEIKVDRDVDGSFISKIHARSKRKIFHAVKKDGNFRRSLDKSFHAIVSQIHRMKDKIKKNRYTDVIRRTYDSEYL